MSEKEFEKVNINSDDAADKKLASEEVSDKTAEDVVGGYEDPSVQGAGDGGEVAGVFFVPVVVAANANVVINVNAAANANAAMNANAVTTVNANAVANANAAINVNASVNANTVDNGENNG